MFSLEIGKDAASVGHDVIDGRVFHKHALYKTSVESVLVLVEGIFTLSASVHSLLIRSDSESVLVYISKGKATRERYKIPVLESVR